MATGQALKFYKVTSLPTASSTLKGNIYFNDTDKTINICNGSSYSVYKGTDTDTDTWRPLGTTSDTAAAGNHTHNYAGSSSAGGSATSAVKLDTASAGASNLPIYWTSGKPAAVSSVGEGYLSWGGNSFADSVSPVGMSLSAEHSANRFAYINGDAITMEYSSDGGSTYTDYGYSAAAKSQFCTTSNSIPIGRASGEYTTSSRTRITFTCQNGTTDYVYTNPRKMLINVSTSGGMQVLVETRTGTDYQNSGSWSTFGTYSLSGWPGWNDIPLILGTLGGGPTQTWHNWQLRLTFIMTSKSSSYPITAHVNSIRIFGENDWSTPSNMARTGHLYSYDMSQNATFPNAVTAANFYVNGAAVSVNGHSHSSANVTALTGYSKASSYSAVAATDSLNTALGKLSAAVDGVETLLAAI